MSNETPITIQPNESTEVELLGSGYKVRVRHLLTDDGHAVILEGVNCDLEGEMPGEYWLAPSGTIAAHYGG